MYPRAQLRAARIPSNIVVRCQPTCDRAHRYRDLAEMMQERGVEVDASTIFRWVRRYAPELEKRLRWYQGYRLSSWRVDAAVVFYMNGNSINQHVGTPFLRYA